MKAWLTVLALALAGLSVVFSGCGDDDALTAGDGVGDGLPPDNLPPVEITLDEICNPTDGTFVMLGTKTAECFPLIELQLSQVMPTADQLSAVCEGWYQPLVHDGSVELGTVEELLACRAYLDSLTCESLTSLDAPSPCQALLVGTLPEATECDHSAQCSGASYCARTQEDSCGQCTLKLADGAECTSDEQCHSGNCAGGGLPGAPSTCRTYADVGEACTQNVDCKGTSVCRDAACAAEPAWSEGTLCNPANLLACNPSQTGLYCGVDSTCQAFAQVGEACSPEAPCNVFRHESCQLDPNSNTMQCVAPTIVDEGEVCDNPGLKCADGLLCGGVGPNSPARCYAPRDQDQSCSDAGELCAPLLECSPDGSCQYGTYSGQCPAPQ